MIAELDRVITWTEKYGFSQQEIANLLNTLAGEDPSLEVTPAAARFEDNLRTAVPDPARRAALLCRFIQFSPEEEPKPEEISERAELLPMLLHAVQELVETSDSQAEAAEALRAIF